MNDRQIPPPPIDADLEPHRHHWEAAGVIKVPNGDRGALGETLPAVAQSCHCGAARAVVVKRALVLADELGEVG